MIVWKKRGACAGRACRMLRILLYRVRRIRPGWWVLLIAAALSLVVTTVPRRYWRILRAGMTEHKGIVTLLVVFIFLALSLIWSAGQRIDAYVFSCFNIMGHKRPWLDRVMALMTELGNGIVTAVILLAFYFAVNHLLAYEFVLGTLTLWLFVELIKITVRRPRPFTRLADVRVVGGRARGKSFPSGHTSQAFFIATLVAQHFHAGILGVVGLYFLAAFVGVTRMYLGMHYPRDVLAGAILGSVWATISMSAIGYLLQ
ncbi:MAG: phosphatase PAP2 family protein [Clostridiales bacterium]|nr:phosphatase PAP2 family protein [Clostridiales bacterium]